MSQRAGWAAPWAGRARPGAVYDKPHGRRLLWHRGSDLLCPVPCRPVCHPVRRVRDAASSLPPGPPHAEGNVLDHADDDTEDATDDHRHNKPAMEIGRLWLLLVLLVVPLCRAGLLDYVDELPACGVRTSPLPTQRGATRLPVHFQLTPVPPLIVRLPHHRDPGLGMQDLHQRDLHLQQRGAPRAHGDLSEREVQDYRTAQSVPVPPWARSPLGDGVPAIRRAPQTDSRSQRSPRSTRRLATNPSGTGPLTSPSSLSWISSPWPWSSYGSTYGGPSRPNSRPMIWSLLLWWYSGSSSKGSACRVRWPLVTCFAIAVGLPF